jgi:UDP-N-acetylmuramoyl-tripeptide--D-alanyl-D-alanine ligase
MFELGNDSFQEHQNIINKLYLNANFDCHIIGKEFFLAKKQKSNLYYYQSFDEFSKYLQNNPFENSFILIKGSRGMALERTLQYI